MKSALLSLCLLTPIAGAAQSTPSSTVPPALVATGSFFALSVADLAASTRWYSEKLGLRIAMQVPKQNGTAVTVLEGGGLTVELIQHDGARPLPTGPSGMRDPLLVHGLFKAGVLVDDFARTMEALRARQVDIAFGPFPARDGQRANVIVRDNAGNLIQFFGK